MRIGRNTAHPDCDSHTRGAAFICRFAKLINLPNLLSYEGRFLSASDKAAICAYKFIGWASTETTPSQIKGIYYGAFAKSWRLGPAIKATFNDAYLFMKRIAAKHCPTQVFTLPPEIYEGYRQDSSNHIWGPWKHRKSLRELNFYDCFQYFLYKLEDACHKRPNELMPKTENPKDESRILILATDMRQSPVPGVLSLHRPTKQLRQRNCKRFEELPMTKSYNPNERIVGPQHAYDKVVLLCRLYGIDMTKPIKIPSPQGKHWGIVTTPKHRSWMRALARILGYDDRVVAMIIPRGNRKQAMQRVQRNTENGYVAASIVRHAGPVIGHTAYNKPDRLTLAITRDESRRAPPGAALRIPSGVINTSMIINSSSPIIKGLSVCTIYLHCP